VENLFVSITSNLTTAINTKIDRIIELAPFVLGAIAVFLFGWILAIMAAKMIIALGHKIKLEYVAEKIGLKHFLDRIEAKVTPSELIAKGMKGYLIFLFFIEATKIAQFTEVAEFLTKVINYFPEVIIALFIMLVGIRMGHTLQAVITTSLSFAKANTANVLGLAAKYTIITFAVLAALTQLDIAEILINVMFIGFISFLALAGALAFGLGGKDVVHELLEDIKKVELKEIRKEIKAELKHTKKKK
jgi:hypothetical protein